MLLQNLVAVFDLVVVLWHFIYSSTAKSLAVESLKPNQRRTRSYSKVVPQVFLPPPKMISKFGYHSRRDNVIMILICSNRNESLETLAQTFVHFIRVIQETKIWCFLGHHFTYPTNNRFCVEYLSYSCLFQCSNHYTKCANFLLYHLFRAARSNV